MGPKKVKSVIKEEDPDMISKDPEERKKQDEEAVRIQANWKGKQDREKVK